MYTLRKGTMSKHPMLLGAALGAASTLGGALGAAWYVNSQVNPLPPQNFDYHYTFTPWELDVPYEALTLHTQDHVALPGWWLPRPNTTRVVIGCHGHIGRKDDLLGIGSMLWRAGYNVLLFDMRGRGEAAPRPRMLASPREVHDVLTATAYVRERLPGAHIGVIGFSMGAAVALLAAEQDPSLAAVVADSPFTSAADVVGYQIHCTAPAVAGPVLALSEALIAQLHGYYLSRVRPIDAVTHLSPRPLLLIHCTEDKMIPIEHAHRIFDRAGKPKELWIYQGVDHCGAYFDDRITYVERVRDFFDRHLGSSSE
jgi:fermentation-respiration switch protein FrsA (DUF1100 family)